MTKLKKWLLSSLIILLVTGISLAILWLKQGNYPFISEQSNPLRVAVPVGPASATFYIALEDGLFSKESNIEVKHQPFPSGRLALDALLGGGVDLALVAETPLVFAALNSKEFRILAVVAQSPHKFVLHKKNTNSTAKFIPKYGVPVGTAAQYWMDRYLSSNGANRNATIINIDAQNLVSALVSGSIDGFFCWEPFASMARTQFPNDELDIIDSRGFYTQFFVLVSLKDTIQRDGERLKAFMASLYKASSQISDNTKHNDNIQIVARYSNMSPQDLEVIWHDHDFQVSLPSSLLETMNSEANWAVNSGIASERKIDFTDFLDTSLLITVCPKCEKTRIIR